MRLDDQGSCGPGEVFQQELRYVSVGRGVELGLGMLDDVDAGTPARALTAP